MTTNFAESMQKARDLRVQLDGLGKDDEAEMQFTEWSPGRKMVKLWSMSDGAEIEIPKYMVLGAISKRLRDGRYAFTANRDEAPKVRNGSVKCFLAEGSPERESRLLEEAGLDHLEPCPANQLRSAYSKRIHAINRHPQSWATLQEYRQEAEREENRKEQRQQTEAMMRLAGSVADEERPRRGRPPKDGG